MSVGYRLLITTKGDQPFLTRILDRATARLLYRFFSYSPTTKIVAYVVEQDGKLYQIPAHDLLVREDKSYGAETII